MHRRRHPAGMQPDAGDVDTALAAMSADALRAVIRDMLGELDDRARSRVVSALVGRAARGGAGWAPAALAEEKVVEALAFANAAERTGQADPADVDAYLRRGSSAFLRKDYPAAHRILGALLRPLSEGDIDLGQDELVDEVLGVEPSECAAQYVVAAYVLAPPAERAEAVRAAMDTVQGVARFVEPLRELERVAVEPLPGLADFLPQWQALLARRHVDARAEPWGTEEDGWQREVVQRLEGSAGLGKLARATRRAEDLRAWCRSLADAGNWKAALQAFEEAAGLVTNEAWARGAFLDGAALAAQELGRRDVSRWLARAWRAGPSMVRLCRWLGTAKRGEALRRRAAEALAACPRGAARQRAFLHVLQRELEPAAKLLAAAPGLGWSAGEHPGHLLFPLFAALLGEQRRAATLRSHRGLELDDLEPMPEEEDGARLATPEVEQLLETAGVDAVEDAAARSAVLAAMRRAAERRLAGVTGKQRRSHYGHAAELVAVCVACDASPKTARWATALRDGYARYPALRAQLDRALRTT